MSAGASTDTSGLKPLLWGSSLIQRPCYQRTCDHCNKAGYWVSRRFVRSQRAG